MLHPHFLICGRSQPVCPRKKVFFLRIREEPATSSPLNSLYEVGFNRSEAKLRQSMRSSEFDHEKFRADVGDDEGFFSDNTISLYYQHSSIVKIERLEGADIGVQAWI